MLGFSLSRMVAAPEILCIGSVLWDTIGQTGRAMRAGDDVPGRIHQRPGGVAFNIAAALGRFGRRPALLSVVGTDAPGAALVAAVAAAGIDTGYIRHQADLPTDRYMAIESHGSLVAAIADAHSLEAAGAAILAPLRDGRLGRSDDPYCGTIALDGNLTALLLGEVAKDPAFSAADLRLAPASAGKAMRLGAFLGLPNTTFYANLEEAASLSGTPPQTAPEAARALVGAGASRAIVTAGAAQAADACSEALHVAMPPPVEPRHVTGAGDVFMAAHIAAEIDGHGRDFALAAALQAAATHVAGASA